MRRGVLQAELDVPAGFWRLWPSRRIAIWVGCTADAVMPFVSRPFRRELDLERALLRLHRSGLWLQEANLIRDHSEPERLETIIAAVRGDSRIEGVAGFWGDESGRVYEGVLHRSGDAWLEHPTQAVRWLITAYGLDD
jgi:hypothetical protein